MPRYKDSPEVRAAKKERKEKLREFLSLLDVEDMSDLRSVFKEMVGEVLENGLEAELDDELGYSRYDYRNKETENSRNGHSRKTMKTSAGDLEIADPRLSRPITILYFMPSSVFTQIMKKSQCDVHFPCLLRCETILIFKIFFVLLKHNDFDVLLHILIVRISLVSCREHNLHCF